MRRMSSATRSLRNRSSRSSPTVTGDKDTTQRLSEAADIRNGQQSNLDKWVEPTVRHAVPSFEDTKGLERLGVLEHMAPLGAAPTQKLLQRLKVNLNRSSPRMTPLQLDDTDVSMMETSRTEAGSPTDTEAVPETIKPQEAMVISSPPRGRPAKKDVEEMRQAAEAMNETPSPVKSMSFQNSPKPQSIQDFLRQDRVRNSVQKAIDEANKQSDPKIIPGLELLLEDAKSKTYLWGVLDSIVNKSPTNAQFKVFKRYIKRGIRDYKTNTSESASPVKVNHRTAPPYRGLGTSYPDPMIEVEIYQLLNEPRVKSSHQKLQNALSASQQSSLSSLHAQRTATSAVSGTDDQAKSTSSNSQERSRSASTSSSLSSAKSLPDDYPQDIDGQAEAQRTGGRAIRSATQRQAANRVAASSRTRSSGTHQPDSSQQHSNFPTTIKFVNRKSHKSKHRDDTPLDPQELEARKRVLIQESFGDYNDVPRPESSERTVVNGLHFRDKYSAGHAPTPVVHPNPLLPTTATLLSTGLSQAEPDAVAVNGTAQKRAYDEMDRDDRGALTPSSSSPAPSLPPPPPPAMARGTTPRSSRLPPPNKARKSARVMISPNKPKNGGIIAGFSRLVTNKNNSATNGADSEPEENDEFCASCGGEGILLCCDGCTNSFHHACLEPPLNPDQDVDGEWFCPRCIARRNKQPLPTNGLMARIIRRVDDTIPKAYSLPFDIRDYFEGVKTGDEGEYEETSLPRTQNNIQKMNRAGFFEQPNYKELRDNKGNFITCYKCGETANGRDIVPCDFCPAKWHTDCVTPPMAVPPRRMGGDKPNSYWRCPLHIDQDLTSISRQAELTPGNTGRVPRLRRPKKAIPVDVDMTRGFRNNGIIEVELMKDEMPDIKEISLDGAIYRIPEEGIRLDFIDRVKKNWYEDHAIPRQVGVPLALRERFYRPGHSVLHHPSALTLVGNREPEVSQIGRALAITETAEANARLRQKSFVEQSAILSLIGLSDHSANAGFNAGKTDPLTGLVNQLIADAPPAAEREIKTSERESLLRLQALIQGRLSLLEDNKSAPNGVEDTPRETEAVIPHNNVDSNVRDTGVASADGTEAHDRAEVNNSMDIS